MDQVWSPGETPALISDQPETCGFNKTLCFLFHLADLLRREDYMRELNFLRETHFIVNKLR